MDCITLTITPGVIKKQLLITIQSTKNLFDLHNQLYLILQVGILHIFQNLQKLMSSLTVGL
jgi:hypothetical protein